MFGECDCCLAVADWWRTVHGYDPAEHLRGAYHDKESCDRVIEDAGGVVAIVRAIAEQVGAPETVSPRPGDFAVVEVLGRRWGAILTPSGRWAIKLNDGRLGAFRTCNVLQAWRV